MSPGPPRTPGLTHAADTAIEAFAAAVVFVLRVPLDVRDWNNQRTGRRRRPAGTKENTS